jgi:hypothetical protein
VCEGLACVLLLYLCLTAEMGTISAWCELDLSSSSGCMYWKSVTRWEDEVLSWWLISIRYLPLDPICKAFRLCSLQTDLTFGLSTRWILIENAHRSDLYKMCSPNGTYATSQCYRSDPKRSSRISPRNEVAERDFALYCRIAVKA